MKWILEIENLSKNISGKKVLDNLSFDLESRKMLGLIGPNGSGKTTILNIIAGLVKQDQGSVKIDGHEPGIYTKEIVSYLPQENHLHNWMTIKEEMGFFEDFYKDFDRAKAESLLNEMKIDLNSKIGNMPKDNLEKLRLILVLSRKAKLYLLDEPFIGVDSIVRNEMIDIILKSYNDESSMIFSAHDIRDFERLVDEVVFISGGKIILKGDPDELRVKRGMSIDDLYREVMKNV